VTEVTWKHKFSDAWSATAGFRCTNYKFEVPATRFDWLLSPSLVIAYKINPHWSMEASYSWDLGLSDVPNTPGREYTRNLGAFGVRYSL
jgi:outer membrane scaffolding protein for murein synthesis (MipA/OmpV family)